MRTNLIVLILCSLRILVPAKVFAQYLTEKQILNLEATMNTFIAKQSMNSSNYTGVKKEWEYMTCFISVDTMGMVSNFGVLSADEKKGSTYSCLFKMTANDFTGIELAYCRWKTIVIPFISTGNGKWPMYMDSVMRVRPNRKAGIVSVVENVIWTTPFVYEAVDSRNNGQQFLTHVIRRDVQIWKRQKKHKLTAESVQVTNLFAY